MIEDNERLAGPGPKYRVPLDVEIPKGDQTQRIPRTVVFRLGRSGRSISYAMAGYVEGTLQLEGREDARSAASMPTATAAWPIRSTCCG